VVAGSQSTISRELLYAQRRQAKVAQKSRKYGNQTCVIDGFSFDSKAEARYYLKLKTELQAGEIRNLRMQVPFELAPSCVIAGRKRPPLRYIADFTYERVRDGSFVVADVKGVAADVYRVKRHLMKAYLNLDIEEIRS
jgi:hypothetical protein